MLRVMFWNVGRASVEIIAEVAVAERADVLVLAELRHGVVSCLSALNERSRSLYHVNRSNCPRIRLYSKFTDEHVQAVSDSKHAAIRLVRLPVGDPFLLVCVHLRSKLHQSSESHSLSMLPAVEEIRAAEERLRTSRTVVIGDLNADPYEVPVVAANGLHGVMTRQRARLGSRTVDGVEYPYFYNPMWSYLGDLSAGPPGTYHYARSEHVERFWHCFDQVLLRPAMLDHFREDGIRIVTEANGLSLASAAGYPDGSELSDHFPVVLTLHV